MLREQAERLGGASIGVPFLRILVVVDLANQVCANVISGPECLFDRGAEAKAGNLAHFLENFVGRGQKFRGLFTPGRRVRGPGLGKARSKAPEQ